MNEKIFKEDVERILNNAERQTEIAQNYAKRKRKRNMRKLIDSFVFAVFSTAFALFGWLCWIIPWLAFPVSIACGFWSMFCLGRWFEHGKCWGWR